MFSSQATPQKQELALLAAKLHSSDGRSKNEAFEHLIRLAEQGSSEAMYLMHLCYERGNGVPLSDEASRYWLDRACNNPRPYPQALAVKGRLLIDEPGKHLQGLALLAKAASMGSAEAAMSASRIYEEGKLVATDILRAYALLAHALDLGGPSITRAFAEFSARNHDKLKGVFA